MLTFFEYLRQRAFESVLSGAQEALQLLESQATFDKVTNPDRPASKQIGQAALDEGDVTEDLGDNNPAAATARLTDNKRELLPAPRLRGRSKRKGSRKR